MIETGLLRLVPHTGAQLLALIENPDEYAKLAGFPAAAGLHEFFISDDVSQWFLDSLRTLPESTKALAAYAFEDDLVRLVRADTAPPANASTKVLTKCGFEFTGEVVDPDDGQVWRWELPRHRR